MDTLFIFGAKYVIVVSAMIFGLVFLMLPRYEKRRMAIFSVVALPVIFVVSRLASLAYFDPRPFVVGGFAPLIPHAADNGFPSDHMLLATAIAVVLYPFNKKASVAAFIAALIVGISRIYVGVHHPVDIIGSAAISIVIGCACYRAIVIFPHFFRKNK